METVKRYYQDAYLKDIETAVIDVKKEDGLLLLALEETIFYPGGGGQLPDSGTINGIEVQKITAADGKVYHHLPLDADLEKGMTARLNINWPERYYNMQQHSGQHLLSYVLYKHGLQTVSVHLGKEYTLIELEGNFDGQADDFLDKIEDECNRLINKALPVKTYWITREEIAEYPLRRPAGDWENLRIVEIDKIDYSACGGTHVQNTAEIGLIKISGYEKIRGHIRLKALIGQKAYAYFKQIHEIVESLKTELPADLQNIVSRTRGLKEDIRDIKKTKKYYQGLYIDMLCRSFLVQENTVLIYNLQGADAEALQLLAGCIKKRNDLNVFIISGNRFCFIMEESRKELTTEFLSHYRNEFSLKGGGPPGFIQGTIAELDEKKLKAAFDELTTKINKKAE